MNARPRLVMDIETAPSDRALELPPDDAWLAPPANYTKADTIAAYVEKQRAAWPAEIARRASLDWRLGRIIAIGWQVNDCDPVTYYSESEGYLLSQFWAAVGTVPTCQLVGFAIANFDLPWILGRSAALRVTPSRRFNGNRYRPDTTDVLDWADVLGNYGSFSPKGWTLARYADWFGLPATVGTGAEMAAAWQTRDVMAIIGHLEADIRTTAALDQLFRPVFCP